MSIKTVRKKHELTDNFFLLNQCSSAKTIDGQKSRLSPKNSNCTQKLALYSTIITNKYIPQKTGNNHLRQANCERLASSVASTSFWLEAIFSLFEMSG